MDRIKTVIKASILIICILAVVYTVDIILTPKYFYDDEWPTTATYLDFYDLERDSVDVLFMGSSHAGSFFNPQILYDTYNIVSYNLSSEQQSMLVTYYWLKEALRYQSPKVVVIDTHMMHRYDDMVGDGLNSRESSVRKTIDFMHWSKVKMDAIRDITTLDPSQSEAGFYLPNIRYHSRWNEITENDIKYHSMAAHGWIKGFLAILKTDRNVDYQPFSDGDSQEIEPFMDSMAVYLDRIRELCDSKGIKLILVNVPCGESIERYNATKQYADEHGLDYYDFNEAALYDGIGYSASSHGLGHANIWGAGKLTTFMGQLLASEYGVGPREDKSFDKTRLMYTNVIKDSELVNSADIYTYLDMLGDARYSLILSGKGEFKNCLDDEIYAKLEQLGFNGIRDVPNDTYYLGIRSDGKTYEMDEADHIVYSGSLRNGYTVYKVDEGRISDELKLDTISIDDRNYGMESPGLQIIVYDDEKKKVIDSVLFDTTSDSLEAKRSEIVVNGNVLVLQ